MAALGLAAPNAGSAQVQLGPTLALHDDFDFGLGAALSVQAPSLGERLGFQADLIFFFPDNDAVDYLEINGNVTYDFTLPESTVAPFGLVGLNIARVSVESVGLEDSSNTELGFNLGGGVRFNVGGFRPSIGVRAEINGGEGVVLFATLPFDVAGR
jgi:opacity protein-like surface antigen